MARRKSELSSRTSRGAFPISDAPVWEVIGQGVRLGYRRGKRGGTWLAGTRRPNGERVQTKLGRADDNAAADGLLVLDHDQAKDAARKWVKSVLTTVEPPARVTVDGTLDDYFADGEARGLKSIKDARQRAALHIRPQLGSLDLSELTSDRLRRWLNSMAVSPKKVRQPKFPKPAKANNASADKPEPKPSADPDAQRRRRDTANRVLTILKAALNFAYHHGKCEDDKAWRLVKPFKNTTASRVRFLDAAEQTRLLNTCEGGLRNLIAAALMTGARFGELARLQVRDFDPANGSVHIAESKSGRGRHVPLPPAGVKLFTALVAGRLPTAFLLTTDSGTAWAKASYHRDFKATLVRAKIENLTLHELRHTYASTMVRAGAPLIVVAEALGHASTVMVEKHYAHLARSYVIDTIRATAPNLPVATGEIQSLPVREAAQ